MKINFFTTKTSKIHLHVEHLLQNTYCMLAEELRLPKRQETPHVPGVLVLGPVVGPEPLMRESRVQDTGPPKTSRPYIISISESSPRDLRLNTKTQIHATTSKLQCWTPHAKQLAKKEHKLHPLTERLPKIISSQTPQNTPPDTVLPTRKTRSSHIHQNTGTSPLHQEAYTTH